MMFFMIFGQKSVYLIPTDEIYPMDVPKFMNFYIEICFFNDFQVVWILSTDQRSTRQFFHEVAHASIMRLSRTSMDKLHSLMVMVFKYQVMHCMVLKDVNERINISAALCGRSGVGYTKETTNKRILRSGRGLNS